MRIARLVFSTRSFAALLVAILGFTTNAVAKKSEEISLVVPSSELELSGQIQNKNWVEPMALELSVSSMSPTSFARPTYSSGEQEFRSGEVPFVSLNHISPLLKTGDSAGFYAKLGISMMTLTRAVDVERGPNIIPSNQDLNVFSLRAGVELKGGGWLSGKVQPYAGLALLPTAVIGSRSQLEGPVSERGVPVEITAGILTHARAFGLENGSLGVGLHFVNGQVAGSTMKGLGAQGFFRIDL